MKIIYYCQHVLGIGHFFRSLEICRALNSHRVVMVTGGPGEIHVPLPEHVRLVQLPALMMDSDFRNLFPIQTDRSLEDIRDERSRRLYDVFVTELPDLFLVELYPFGRRAFRFELEPVLADLRNGRLRPCPAVCSLRDILVEKANPQSYERRVVTVLNRDFDALLIHADPRVVKLDETFSRMADIAVEVVYTGFVTPSPPVNGREAIRRRLDIDEHQLLVVASAGGGTVGYPLLEAAAKAVKQMPSDRIGRSVQLRIAAGPLMPEDQYRRLEQLSDGRIHVQRFYEDFLPLLAAADLSVSMAGYNTCMNVLAAGTSALLRPFGQNREQRMRAQRLSAYGWVEVLDDEDLDPARLAERMRRALSHPKAARGDIDLDGAMHTAQWIQSRMNHAATGRERISRS